MMRLLHLVLVACSLACAAPLPAQQLPAQSMKVLQAHIASAIRDGTATSWSTAKIAKVIPLYRPDIDGPAYYEVQLSVAGRPAGYAIVATGRHDFPVPQWSTSGLPPSALAMRAAPAAHGSGMRLLRFGLHTVAETSDGRMLASWPRLTPPASSLRAKTAAQAAGHGPGSDMPWATRRATLVRAVRDLYAIERNDIGVAWNALSSPSGDTATTPTCSVPGWSTQPSYRQLQPHEAPNGEWYHSGCGPTAWTMLIGWIEQRALLGDPRWSAYWQLLTQGGQADPFAADVTAPTIMDSNVSNLTEHFRDLLGTWGSGTKEGVTEPWRMERIADYLDQVNLGNGELRSWVDTTHGAQSDRLKALAKAKICAGFPAVLGIGALEHYALATAWRNDGEFYLDMGWEGAGNGWYREGIFFVGTLEPGGGVMPPARLINTATGQCADIRDGGSAKDKPVQQWGCAGTRNQFWQLRANLAIAGMNEQCIEGRESGSLAGVSRGVWMADCEFPKNAQGWRVGPIQFVSADGRCLAYAPGTPNPLQFQACAIDSPTQQWRTSGSGTISQQSGLCLTNQAGAPAMLPCANAPGQSWLIDPLGQVRALSEPPDPLPMSYPPLCLTRFKIPLPGLPDNLAIKPCVGAGFAKWRLHTTIERQGGGCLTVPGGSSTMGTALRTEICDRTPKQVWELAFGQA